MSLNILDVVTAVLPRWSFPDTVRGLVLGDCHPIMKGFRISGLEQPDTGKHGRNKFPFLKNLIPSFSIVREIDDLWY